MPAYRPLCRAGARQVWRPGPAELIAAAGTGRRDAAGAARRRAI